MLHRRNFLTNAAAAAAAVGFSGQQSAAATQRSADVSFEGRIRKAVKYHMIREDRPAIDKLRMLQDLGFDGVEARTMLQPNQSRILKELGNAREKTGLPIHGLVNGSNPELVPAVRQAKQLGANSVLHIVRADEQANYLQNVSKTKDLILRAVEEAEKLQVRILVENVWASWIIEPLTMARFIDDIGSPWVQVYFDVGNVVRWGWPHHWIQVLGKRIAKLDIKEFDLQVAMNEGMRKAFDKPLGQGTVNWEKVRHELHQIDYRGWATAEVRGGDQARLADIATQMNDVLHLT